MNLYNLKELVPLGIKNRFSKEQKDKITRLLRTLNTSVSNKKGKSDFLKSSISAFRRSNTVWGMPTIITIEPTSVCDQKCPICETGNGSLGRSKRFMSFDKFKSIIEMIENHTNEILLYFMGEAFLNKDIYKMIKYARSKGIWINTCTNGNFVDPERLILSEINEIQFQINGTTQEIHEIYRVGGDLDKTKKAIEKSIMIRNQINTDTNIVVGFIVMKHNVNQIEEFKKYCNSIGVDRFDLVKPCVRTTEEAKIYIPDEEKWWIYQKDKFDKENILIPINPPNNYCDWLYFGMNIYVNGDVVPCCRDVSGKYVMGNVFEESLENIWNNEKYQNFRKKILTDQQSISICKLCEGYGRPLLK